ncbi:hypothetical protein H2204_005279 [Knufia peltigerae]|uniref:Shikimate dehydrogenase substrate binding N-terminal domain-containing protein n=1 Tax=Knufia peltigerae TaxID=1002370 RepID=A0AA39CXN8_9EURO|nr:hypothetical protein H2204_005279 [Knufia peltigerae]
MATVNSREFKFLNHHPRSVIEPTRLPSTPYAFLLGERISHSLSPHVHHVFWNHMQLRWQFYLLDTPDVDACFKELQSPNCVGCSITMPHKVTGLRFVDNLTEEARIIGAINTIYLRDNPSSNSRTYIGANTDCIGIRDSFLRAFPGVEEICRGQPALVIGAGGTSRAAIYALWKFFDVSTIYLINRSFSEIEEVVKSMSEGGCTTELLPLTTLDQASSLDVPRLIVGTTPDLPAESAEEKHAQKLISITLHKLTRVGDRDGYLLDMCYYPSPHTNLMKAAEMSGWQTVSGVEAVKYQAVAQNRLWSSKPVSELAIKEVSNVIEATLHQCNYLNNCSRERKSLD